MLSSIAVSSWKQYNRSLKMWSNFCEAHHQDPYVGSTAQVIHFLQNELETSTAKYGTFNSHRSALSLIMPDLGGDKDIKRFLKGVARTRPAKPRYNSVWNPAVVVEYIQKFLSEEVTFKNLSYKLITLLALTTAHRIHTLSLIKISDISFISSGVNIKISEPTKTSIQTGYYPFISFSWFKEEPRLCVVKSLSEYISFTEKFRNGEDHLFLTLNKPYKKASVNTLSRWIKGVLSKAGIDISIFGSHSTRHSASSAAWRAGVSLEEIRKAAGWSGQSKTFEKFYKRPLLCENSLSMSILNSCRNAD